MIFFYLTLDELRIACLFYDVYEFSVQIRKYKPEYDKRILIK